MNKPVIAFISQLAIQEQAAWLQLLSAKLPNESIKLEKDLTSEQKLNCEVAIVANPEPCVLLQFPNLKWLQSLWAGVDALVSQLTNGELIPSFKLARLVDPILAQTMSEAVLTWVLYLHRDMPKYLQQQKSAHWQQHRYLLPQERTIGILGLGELGKLSASRLADNGFNVLGWSRSEKLINGVECFSGKSGLSDMLKQTDILVCLLPLTSSTYQLIDNNLLRKLSPQASVINFGRGAIVASNDLVENLNSDHLSHAILDVFEQEPLKKDSVFWLHEKITVLPHISAPTHFESAADIVANNIKQYRKTGVLPTCIDWSKGY